MSGVPVSSDKLQALRSRVTSATTPAERVKAALSLADELWLTAPTQAEPLLELVIAEAEAAGKPKSGARAASILSELLRGAGDLEGSARCAEVVLRVASATGDLRIRAGGLNLVGMIHLERGEHERAGKCFEEALKLSRATGFDKGQRSALNQLAGVYGMRGELDKALACYREGLDASIKVGDSYGRAVCSQNVGWTLGSMGRWNDATEQFHRVIALCEEHDFHDLLLAARMALGELSLQRSDYEDAAHMFNAVITVERELRHSGRQLREALSDLGWTHFRAGDLARAEETLAEAARLSEAVEDRCVLATICRRRAELALAQQRLAAAGELLTQAARHASDLNLKKEQGHVQRTEALLAAARSKPDAALKLFARAEETLKSLGDTFELALTRLQRGRLLLEVDRPEEALPLLKTALGSRLRSRYRLRYTKGHSLRHKRLHG